MTDGTKFSQCLKAVTASPLTVTQKIVMINQSLINQSQPALNQTDQDTSHLVMDLAFTIRHEQLPHSVSMRSSLSDKQPLLLYLKADVIFHKKV